MLHTSKRANTLLILALLSGHAQADLTEWVAAVALGAPASFSSTSISVPSIVDIGTISAPQGLTYEFVINCTNAGASSALMGAKNTGNGTDSALKFEQFSNTNSFGITHWGVADWTIAPNTPLQDIHVAFVVDSVGISTELFVDGVPLGTVPHAPHLTNMVGLGYWYDPGASVDYLTGTIYGVAVYESMLSPTELLEHANAFLSTQPGDRFCFGIGCPCGNDDANGGCFNSTGSGASLESQGTAGVGADDLVFLGSHLKPGSTAILFAGTTQLNSGAGQIFGDGLRCTGGPLRRLGIRTADSNGDASWGPGLLASTNWVVPGDIRNVQIWNSDPPSIGPCATGFNTSNGLRLVFAP